VTLTQDLIAIMLGVRREGITEAAGKLQQAGFILYRRGHITVIDRAGLEKLACECYQTVKMEFDRLLPDVTATNAVETPCIQISNAPASLGEQPFQTHARIASMYQLK
jgi:DNA-binding transcriptional regulator YhcF (GntR family)